MDDLTVRDPSADFPLETWEVEKLAAYNTEVSRGLVHTDEYRKRMARLQRRFDTVGYVSARQTRRLALRQCRGDGATSRNR